MPAPTPVVQFGTSRFLQAHADLFFSEGTPEGAITVVQSSGDPSRAGRLGALAAPGGYPVLIRGIEEGAVVDEERRVHSVKRTLSTASDWAELSRIVTEEAEVILSNTGDAGYDPKPADTAAAPEQAMSYPAKLFHLLKARHAAGKAPLTIFPMELIPDNGHVLKARVLDIAAQQGADSALTGWLGTCIWANSLVDRIVSAPLDPVGAVAEPYALWAIEAQPGLDAPVTHPSVRMVDSLETIERLKLHILNLGHTAMAAYWQQAGAAPDAIVRDLLEGPVGDRLARVMEEEVIPGFAARGMEEEARAYLAVTLERFANPFLDHRIADIAQNHPQKIERRIAAFLSWVRAAQPGFAAPALDAICAAAVPA
ncbi:mannitol dehydrogenase family protein [Mangrovicoccus algicola]|uniref:Mannitol dehydrogenase family protein n=1 Tax=Mangrovicoccus algicola TaxID=2771008 RepID=A0A8J7CVX9_9RHOB|nr:mannitol dehydrogenase family protein [Mangrovicoccus algicola]MBE3639284.1 mannitol dehydrogenase family protein [Mangrovicoccus algicola]